jgi:hypothetical protein
MMSAASKPVAFMSYTRFDDEYQGAALTRLREELSKTVQFLHGEEIEIFQDVEGIKLGQNIQQQITASLNETLLLIPILTPSYFKSAWCRDELSSFLDRERQLGRNDLIISIYYQEVRELSEAMKHPGVRGFVNDPLIQEIAPRLASDWRSLRDQDLKAPAVKHELERIARRIIDVVQELQNQSTVQPSVDPSISGMSGGNQSISATPTPQPAPDNTIEYQPAPGKEVAVDRRKLRNVMIQNFNQADLTLLCDDIQEELKKAGIEQQVNLEIVGGSGKELQILNLIQYLDRRGYLSYLIAVVRSVRHELRDLT